MNTIKNQIPLIIFVTLLVASSCGPEEDIYVEVSKGLKPTISWEGGPVARLRIDDISDEGIWSLVLGISVPSNKNSIYSPIKYGIYPDSIELEFDIPIDQTIDSLIEGKKYRAFVRRFGPSGPASGYCEFVATQN